MHFSVNLVVTLIAVEGFAAAANTDNTSTTTTDSTSTSPDSGHSATTTNSSTANNTETGSSGPAYGLHMIHIILSDEWSEALGIVVIAGFWFVVALVIFVLVPVVSISLDRMYFRRNRKTYTVNRRDHIGIELQEATSVTHDAPEREATPLMLPEAEASACGPAPTSPHRPVEENLSTFAFDVNRPYETTVVEPSTESLESVIDRLTNMTETEFNWTSQGENAVPESPRYRSQSHSAGDTSKGPPEENLKLLYAKPHKGRKGPTSSPSDRGNADVVDTSGGSGSDERGSESFHLVITGGACDPNPETSHEMPSCPEKWKNQSYLHSTAASDSEAIKKWKPKTTVEDEAPKSSEPHLSSAHVYEDLDVGRCKGISPGVRSSISDGNLKSIGTCRITIPQYFEVNDCKNPQMATLPGQEASCGSLALGSLDMLTATDDEPWEMGDPEQREEDKSVVRVRMRKGLLASGPLSTQYRLSDGALDVSRVVPQQYSSLQRTSRAGPTDGKHKVATYYSKLKRYKPAAQANLPVSTNVYNKLVICQTPGANPAEIRAVGMSQSVPIIETSL